MAEYYRIPKTPTVFEQTEEGVRPITSGADFTQFDDVKDITPEELQGLRDRFGVGSPVGAETLKEIGTGKLFQYGDKGIRPISERGAKLAGGKIGEVGPGGLGLYKTGSPISDYEAATIMPQRIKESIEGRLGVKELETKEKSILGKLVERVKALPGKITGKREELFKGTEEKRQIVADIDKEIADKTASYEKQIEQVSTQPMSLASIRGEQERQTRLANIELKGLEAKKAAAQGDFNSAYNLARDAYVDFKETASLELESLNTQLALVREQLGGAESKVADELQFALDERERELKLEDSLLDEKIGLMLSEPRADILMSDTFEEAVEKAKPFLSEDEILDIQKTKADIARTWDLIGGGTKPTKLAKDQFTETQINKGASAAGMTIAEFSELPVDEANQYITGAKKDLEGGRLPEKTMEEYQTFITEAISGGESIEAIMDAVARNEVPGEDIPARDRQVLLNWMEEKYPVRSGSGGGWFGTGGKRKK